MLTTALRPDSPIARFLEFLEAKGQTTEYITRLVNAFNPAAAEGVIVFPGRPWFPAEPPAPFLRLTFAAAPPEALDEGVRRLARALR